MNANNRATIKNRNYPVKTVKSLAIPCLNQLKEEEEEEGLTPVSG